MCRLRYTNKNYKEITLEVSETKPADPEWDQLYADFCIEPVNARYDVDENGRTFVVESVKGRGIDMEVVKESYRTGNWEKKSFLGFAISPEITTADIDTNLFQDVLGTKTTTYDPSELSRSHNVELAAASIDGCIILPGYKFSFNNTVGERTEERGYQDALIYINDGVEPGLGGGICQVSSTLYNATLEAELKQEMRECHQFTVFYVDLGMDATVAWGNIDYIFSNNTEYPIKIVSKAENGKLTMSILGTADYETKDISFRSEIVAVYPHHTNTTLNEALAPGVKDIKTHGRSGYQVNTYKTVTVDGEKRPEQWVDVSYYDPLDTVVIEGPPLETTAAVTTTTKATTTTATPPPTTAVTTVPPTSAGIITGTTQPPQTVATPSSPGGVPAEPPAA